MTIEEFNELMDTTEISIIHEIRDIAYELIERKLPGTPTYPIHNGRVNRDVLECWHTAILVWEHSR